MAKLAAVNITQLEQGNKRLDELLLDVDDIEIKSNELEENIDNLMNSTDVLELIKNASPESLNELTDVMSKSAEDINTTPKYKSLDVMDIDQDWGNLLTEINSYAERNELDLSNPYMAAMSNYELSLFSDEMMKKYNISKLDKYDYAFAGSIGILMGLVDVFLVGSVTDGNNKKTKGEQGALSKRVDECYENIVQKMGQNAKANDILTDKEKYIKSQLDQNLPVSAAKIRQFDDRIEKAKNADPKKAIKFLEDKFKVNYDAAHNGYVSGEGVSGMNASNHHLKSLAHDPGPLGLVIGIIDLMTGKSTMIDSNGQIIRVLTKNDTSIAGEGNTLQQIIEATTTWFGHTMSDVSGSSGAKGRGAGLPMPFYSVTQKMQFGQFDVNGKDMNVAELSEWIYKQGLDSRAVTAQAIPVIVMHILIMLYWIFKSKYYHKKTWRESLPIGENKKDVNKLYLFAQSTFTIVDVGDAVLRKGVTPAALLRINYVGILNLGFRSVQQMRLEWNHKRQMQEIVDSDIQAEWDRVLEG